MGYIITRLLGRPQPQMYPPVALNQYTLVNRTHKHFIYMLRLYKHFKITLKLSSQQHVKYGSNLMIFFSNLCFHYSGVLGQRMLNPKVLKCHEELITLDTYAQQGKTMDNKLYICENINIFGYMGARGGGGGGGHVGLLHRIQGYQMSANADLITVETYVQQGETI